MDFELSEEHKLIRKTARKFAEEVIRPAAKHHDETCEYPYEIIEEAKKLDLIAPAIPEQYGGAGAGLPRGRHRHRRAVPR
jgi:alkylation response protein AidB-like acyl-CoA dehydrogenase